MSSSPIIVVCGENYFQYFVNVYWAMLEGHAQYIAMG
jgi:hypothetical protein